MQSIVNRKRAPKSRFCIVSGRNQERFNGLFWYLLEVNKGIEHRRGDLSGEKAAVR